MSYVKAAKELPRLSVQDMERLAHQYGLTDDVFNRAHGLVSKEVSSTEHVESDVAKMA
jgi:D-alanyl-D-alanine carboxypeptidase